MLRGAAVQIALGVALFFVLDAAVFRSGLYERWVAPLSGLGNAVRALDNIRRLPTSKRGVVVMGDSRIGEGFSASVATRAAGEAGSDLVFASGGVSSSLPRVWYYLLRQTPAPLERIAAVAIMLTSYHDDEREPQAQRRGDMVFVHPALRLTDLVDFPWSYPSAEARLEAVESILFKGLFYKNDLVDLLANPGKRFAEASAWRKHGHEWSAGYPGRPGTLEGLRFDMETGELAIDPGHPSAVPNTLPEYAALLRQYRGRLPENPAATAYRREWLGRIADWCRDQGATLFVFRIPRGPLHGLVDADERPSGVVADMAQAGRIVLLPAATFDGLERPEDFFDDLHLNGAGRTGLSTGLALAIVPRMKAAR